MRVDGLMMAGIKRFLANRGIRRMLWVALILSFLLAAWNGMTSYIDKMAMYLRISIKTSQSGSGVLFYDVGRKYNQDDLSSAFIPGDDQFHEIRFRLPVLRPIYHLRFDPPSGKEGQITINRVELIDHYGRLLKHYDLKRLQPLNQIKQFSFDDGEVRFSIDEPGNDPYIDLGLDRPIPVDRFQFLLMLFNGIMLEGTVIFAIALLLIVCWSRFTDKTTATLIVLALFSAGWFLHQEILKFHKGAITSYFKVSMMSDVRGIAKLYYDLGKGINEADLFAVEVLPGGDIHADDAFKEYLFKIPGRFFQLRFDPLEGRGKLTIRKMEITDQYGKVLHTVTPDFLKPNEDIASLEKRGQELVVVINKHDGDPQIDIRHADKFSPKPSETFPLWIFLRVILITWAEVGVCLLAALVIRRRYAQIISRFIDGTFFQQKLHLIYLGCALALVLAMAMVSNPQGNPDEMGHEKCADYYADNWLPSAVDDETIHHTLSGYGVSYLFRMEVVYFLAGKASVLLSGLINYSYLNSRLFNVFLFGLLVMMAIRRTQSPLLFILGLVATPQVWYIFSYFNGDAFPLFIALLIAAQVMYADSLSSRYLDSPFLWERVSGGMLLGILAGLMLLSKPNYYVYLVFIAVILILRLFLESGPRRTGGLVLQMKKGLLVTGIALCVYLPPTVYDQYINGFQKEARIIKVVEQKAADQFKPSTVENKPHESYRGLALRDKGVPLRGLFLEWDEWRQMSYKSFFGVYGYMLYYAKSYHYKAVFILLAGGFLFIIFHAAYHSLPLRDILVLLMVLFFSLLVIGQSVYFSWTADYEPQGRYLFPIIPMVLVGLMRLPEMIRQRFIPCFTLCLFLLSLSSFVFTALLYIPKVD